jgi:hypothetical protein
MPTTRPRHVVTETEQIARALDDAARRWPEESSRAKLLLRLVDEGHQAVTAQHDHRVAARHEAIARTSGALTGVYRRDYLTELREDWPA